MILLPLLLAAATPLAAAPDCGDQTTQTAMNQCAGREYQAADAAMNAQWRTTQAAMKRRGIANTTRGGGFGYAAALLASQRAWLRFRDAQCVIEGGEYAGGSLQPFTQARCKTRLTRQRTGQLRALDWTR